MSAEAKAGSSLGSLFAAERVKIVGIGFAYLIEPVLSPAFLTQD